MNTGRVTNDWSVRSGVPSDSNEWCTMAYPARVMSVGHNGVPSQNNEWCHNGVPSEWKLDVLTADTVR